MDVLEHTTNPLGGNPHATFTFPLPGAEAAIFPALVDTAVYKKVTHTDNSPYSRGTSTYSTDQRRWVVIHISLEGEGRLRLGEKVHTLTPGDVFMLPVEQDHHYYLPPESDQWILLGFRLQGPGAQTVAHHALARFGAIHRLGLGSRFIKTAVECFLRLPVKPGTENYESSRMAWALMMALCSTLSEMDAGGTRSTTSPALQIIYTNFQKDLTLDQLAAACKMSRFHFSRTFQRENGLSPHKYLERIRLRHAAHRLRETNHPIHAIAEEAGYHDSAYFIKRFRKAYGCTPREFRPRT